MTDRLEFAAHEAGHAVVAAYLRVPFEYVTIKGDEGLGIGGQLIAGALASVRVFSLGKHGSVRRPKAEIDREARRQMTNKAIMALAARAAMDSLVGRWFRVLDAEAAEAEYEGDEKLLRQIAVHLKIRDARFRAWRDGLLSRARDIVAIPHVQHAIRDVAADLVRTQRMSAKQVRHILRLNAEIEGRLQARRA